jgi:hypothetical protein
LTQIRRAVSQKPVICVSPNDIQKNTQWYGKITAEQFNYDSTQNYSHIDFSQFYTLYFVRTDGIKYIPPVAVNADNEDVFNELYAQWREKTKFHSYIGNSTDVYYEKIIQLGWRAVPFIMKKLKEDNAHLFIALSRITGENPVKKENMGKVKKMAEDWIQWWEG